MPAAEIYKISHKMQYLYDLDREENHDPHKTTIYLITDTIN